MIRLQNLVSWKLLACLALPSVAFAQAPTVSGYMEVHLNKEENQPTQADLHRFVLMVGHRFSDRLKFWSEVEVEHAFVEVEGGEETGEVAIEQA